MDFSKFKKLRESNKYREDFVRVWIDDEFTNQFDNDIPFKTDVDLNKVDFRYFADLKIFLHAESYSQKLVDFYNKLKDHTDFVLVGITDFGEDLGWKFVRSVNGEQEIAV